MPHIMLTCAGCGFEAPADFSFCPRCGRKLTGAPPPPAEPQADRRLATILFADLSGFTAIAERLDPEEVRALQTDLFDALRAVLEREQAFVENFIQTGKSRRSTYGMTAKSSNMSENWVMRKHFHNFPLTDKGTDRHSAAHSLSE